MLLTDKELLRRDANWRMNPPLREQRDCEAIIEGFCDGTIDAMITDHAPHSPEEKADFEKAPNGIIGLETSFAASCTALVASGRMSLARLIELMSVNPCRILSIPGGEIRVGGPADLVLLAPGGALDLHRGRHRFQVPEHPVPGHRIHRPGTLHHQGRRDHLAAQEVSGHALACDHKD